MKNYISAALVALGLLALGLCIKAGIANFSTATAWSPCAAFAKRK